MSFRGLWVKGKDKYLVAFTYVTVTNYNQFKHYWYLPVFVVQKLVNCRVTSFTACIEHKCQECCTLIGYVGSQDHT